MTLDEGEYYVTAQFAPVSAGSKSATLQFQSNDPDENPFEISLYGNGLFISGINSLICSAIRTKIHASYSSLVHQAHFSFLHIPSDLG